MQRKEAEYTIIGAGLTGLTLAFYLAKSGAKVILLERSSRIGGVIQTRRAQYWHNRFTGNC